MSVTEISEKLELHERKRVAYLRGRDFIMVLIGSLNNLKKNKKNI